MKEKDQESMGDWLLSLMRDRYRVICEDRNAYQDAQTNMIEAISTQKDQKAQLELQNRMLMADLAAAQKLRDDTAAVLQSSLVVLGVTE